MTGSKLTLWTIGCGLALLIGACGSSPSTDGTSDADGDDTSSDDSVIDGGPAQPDAAAGSRDPHDPGTWDVQVTDGIGVAVADGTTTLTVYAPSADGGATAAPGPFPLVVVSPGFQIGRANYAVTATRIATWGYIVVTRDYGGGNHQAKAIEVGNVIDWALDAAGPLGTRVDASKIAVAGHSLGGKVSILAAIDEPRIAASVGWDPVDALPPFGNDGSTSVAPERLADLHVPLLLLGETEDSDGGMACAPAADNYSQYFMGACLAPALQITIAGADHTDWTDDRDACGFACFFCGDAASSDDEVRAVSRAATIAWLELHLRGDLTMVEQLTMAALGPLASVVAGPSADCP